MKDGKRISQLNLFGSVKTSVRKEELLRKSAMKSLLTSSVLNLGGVIGNGVNSPTEANRKIREELMKSMCEPLVEENREDSHLTDESGDNGSSKKDD